MDQQAVPFAAILFEQQDRLTRWADARPHPRRLDFHERHEAMDLALAGHQRGEHASEAQRVLGELGAQHVVAHRGRIAFVEDEVDGLEDRRETPPALRARRDLKRNARLRKRPLRAHDALRDRRFRREKRAGDLRGGEAAEQLERQRDVRLLRHDRMARHEHEAQQIVVDLLVRRGNVGL